MMSFFAHRIILPGGAVFGSMQPFQSSKREQSLSCTAIIRLTLAQFAGQSVRCKPQVLAGVLIDNGQAPKPTSVFDDDQGKLYAERPAFWCGWLHIKIHDGGDQPFAENDALKPWVGKILANLSLDHARCGGFSGDFVERTQSNIFVSSKTALAACLSRDRH